MKAFLTAVNRLFLVFCFALFSFYSFDQCSISGLEPTYCISDPSSTLTGSPGGGTFSGPGISGSTFSPSAAGVGVHTITYELAGDEDKYYIKSVIGNPWGNTSNNTAMNNAFGPGGWILGSFEGVSPATVFSASTSFVFLEGSDAHAIELNTFLITNLPIIESWVADGAACCLTLHQTKEVI